MATKSPRRLSVNLTDDLDYKLEFICKARGMNRTELIHKFIEVQYSVLEENSELHKTITDMEQLTQRMQELMSKLEDPKK